MKNIRRGNDTFGTLVGGGCSMMLVNPVVNGKDEQLVLGAERCPLSWAWRRWQYDGGRWTWGILCQLVLFWVVSSLGLIISIQDDFFHAYPLVIQNPFLILRQSDLLKWKSNHTIPLLRSSKNFPLFLQQNPNIYYGLKALPISTKYFITPSTFSHLLATPAFCLSFRH